MSLENTLLDNNIFPWIGANLFVLYALKKLFSIEATNILEWYQCTVLLTEIYKLLTSLYMLPVPFKDHFFTVASDTVVNNSRELLNTGS